LVGTPRRPASRPLVSADFSAQECYAGTGGPRSGSARHWPCQTRREWTWEGWGPLRSWVCGPRGGPKPDAGGERAARS
jgi:hypothetical protein